LPWLLAARRKKLLHLLPLPLLKLLPLQLLLLTQSRLMPLLLLPLRPLTPLLLRLLTPPSLLTLLRPLMQSRLKPLLPSNLRIIVRKTGRKTGFFSSRFSPACFDAPRPAQAGTCTFPRQSLQNASERATSHCSTLIVPSD